MLIEQGMIGSDKGAEQLFGTMGDYYQMDNWEHIDMKSESRYGDFHTRKYICKCRLQNKWYFL